MTKRGRQGNQRSQDKPPICHAPMRDRKVGLTDDGIAIEQKVQVHGSCGPGQMVRGAAQRHLDLLQVVEELVGRKARGNLRYRVQERPPLYALLRLRLEEGGDSRESGAWQKSEPIQGRTAMRQSVSQIGADSDERLDPHGRVISTDTPPMTPGIGGEGFVARIMTC